MWLQGAFGRSDGRSCRRQNISWTGPSSGLPEPGPRLSESSAAGMNSVRVSQRCTCSGLFFCSDFCKPALTVCLLWAWLSTRRQSHDKQLYGWDLPTLQTAYSFLFINNWNIDSMKDEWSRRYKCDAQTAAPHSNQITRWRLVITFRPRWQETAAHLCWGGTEWQFGPTDAEKKSSFAQDSRPDAFILLLQHKQQRTWAMITVPAGQLIMLMIAESKTHLCTDFLWNSSQLWQSHRGHMTEPTWEPRFQLWSADLSARASYQ